MIIENNFIPFKGFLAMNLFGIIFARKEAWNRCDDEKKKRCIRHESIHTKQIIECGFIFFYVIYLLEWLFRLLITWDADKAYRSTSFENEAYKHENDLDYLEHRKPYAMWRK